MFEINIDNHIKKNRFFIYSYIKSIKTKVTKSE